MTTLYQKDDYVQNLIDLYVNTYLNAMNSNFVLTKTKGPISQDPCSYALQEQNPQLQSQSYSAEQNFIQTGQKIPQLKLQPQQPQTQNQPSFSLQFQQPQPQLKLQHQPQLKLQHQTQHQPQLKLQLQQPQIQNQPSFSLQFQQPQTQHQPTLKAMLIPPRAQLQQQNIIRQSPKIIPLRALLQFPGPRTCIPIIPNSELPPLYDDEQLQENKILIPLTVNEIFNRFLILIESYIQNLPLNSKLICEHLPFFIRNAVNKIFEKDPKQKIEDGFIVSLIEIYFVITEYNLTHRSKISLIIDRFIGSGAFNIILETVDHYILRIRNKSYIMSDDVALSTYDDLYANKQIFASRAKLNLPVIIYSSMDILPSKEKFNRHAFIPEWYFEFKYEKILVKDVDPGKYLNLIINITKNATNYGRMYTDWRLDNIMINRSGDYILTDFDFVEIKDNMLKYVDDNMDKFIEVNSVNLLDIGHVELMRIIRNEIYEIEGIESEQEKEEKMQISKTLWYDLLDLTGFDEDFDSNIYTTYRTLNKLYMIIRCIFNNQHYTEINRVYGLFLGLYDLINIYLSNCNKRAYTFRYIHSEYLIDKGVNAIINTFKHACYDNKLISTRLFNTIMNCIKSLNGNADLIFERCLDDDKIENELLMKFKFNDDEMKEAHIVNNPIKFDLKSKSSKDNEKKPKMNTNQDPKINPGLNMLAVKTLNQNQNQNQNVMNLNQAVPHMMYIQNLNTDKPLIATINPPIVSTFKSPCMTTKQPKQEVNTDFFDFGYMYDPECYVPGFHHECV